MSRYAKALLSAIDPRVYFHGLRIAALLRVRARLAGAQARPRARRDLRPERVVPKRRADHDRQRNPHRRVLDHLGRKLRRPHHVRREMPARPARDGHRIELRHRAGHTCDGSAEDRERHRDRVGMLARGRCRRAGRCHDRRRARSSPPARSSPRTCPRTRSSAACRRRSSARGRSQSASPSRLELHDAYGRRDHRQLQHAGSHARMHLTPFCSRTFRVIGWCWWTTARPMAASRPSRRRTPRSFSSTSARTSDSRAV